VRKDPRTNVFLTQTPALVDQAPKEGPDVSSVLTRSPAARVAQEGAHHLSRWGPGCGQDHLGVDLLSVGAMRNFNEPGVYGFSRKILREHRKPSGPRWARILGLARRKKLYLDF